MRKKRKEGRRGRGPFMLSNIVLLCGGPEFVLVVLAEAGQEVPVLAGPVFPSCQSIIYY